MKVCKHCGSKNVIKAGIGYAGHRKQKWLCKDCGRFFYSELEKARVKK